MADLTLPVELIDYIVGLSLPASLEREALPERYELLLRLSLVSSTFRAVSLPYLLKHVHLVNHAQMDAFRDTLLAGAGPAAHKVERVSVGDPHGDPEERTRTPMEDLLSLTQAMRRCPNVVDVNLCDIELMGTDLTIFPRARRLVLDRCFISTGLTTPGGLTSVGLHMRPRDFVLGKLTHLELVAPFTQSRWGTLLHAQTLPSLVSLKVESATSLDDQAYGSPDAFEMGLCRLAPGLTEFATMGQSGLSRVLTHGGLWRAFGNLKHLTLASARPHKALELLQCELDTLRIDYQSRGMDGFVFELSQIFELVEDGAESIRALKQLRLAGWEELSGRRADAVRDFIQRNCDERKIQWIQLDPTEHWTSVVE